MDTKTAKTEALSLLALDELTPGQEQAINLLTARQLGYPEVVMSLDRYNDNPIEFALNRHPNTYYCLFDGMGGVDCPFLPEWTNNVGDCLALFPVDEYVVFMQRNPNHCVCSVRPLEDILFTAAKEEAKTLPLAMLKCWWTLQD